MTDIFEFKDIDIFELKSHRLFREEGVYEPFVYIIKEKDTNKRYIGLKVAKNCLESDLGAKYFTSSKYIKWKTDEFEIEQIISCLSNHDAIILEGLLIEDFNAIEDKNFYNKHHPYVGFNYSGCTHEHSKESIEKLRLAGLNQFDTKEKRDKHSLLMLKVYKENPSISKTQSLKKIEFYKNDENRLMMKNSIKNAWVNNPSLKEEMSCIKLKQYEENPEYVQKISKALKEYHKNNPDMIEEHKNKLKKYYDNEENRKLVSERTKRQFEDPVKRKNHSEARKRFFKENPNAGKEHAERIRNLPKKKCPHCHGYFSPAMFARWHNDNCKLNKGH